MDDGHQSPAQAEEARLLRVHLGCGRKFIPGMMHIDILDAPHIDHVSSIADMPFLSDNSAELIYAAHVLEHFGRHEYINVLREWYRILAPGGVLRLAVPDFAVTAQLYTSNSAEEGLASFIGLVCGGQRDGYDFHKMIYDFPFLAQALQWIGFRKVYRWDWRKTSHAQIDDYSQAYLPHMDKENGTLVSLNIEALK